MGLRRDCNKCGATVLVVSTPGPGIASRLVSMRDDAGVSVTVYLGRPAQTTALVMSGLPARSLPRFRPAQGCGAPPGWPNWPRAHPVVLESLLRT